MVRAVVTDRIPHYMKFQPAAAAAIERGDAFLFYFFPTLDEERMYAAALQEHGPNRIMLAYDTIAGKYAVDKPFNPGFWYEIESRLSPEHEAHMTQVLTEKGVHFEVVSIQTDIVADADDIRQDRDAGDYEKPGPAEAAKQHQKQHRRMKRKA